MMEGGERNCSANNAQLTFILSERKKPRCNGQLKGGKIDKRDITCLLYHTGGGGRGGGIMMQKTEKKGVRDCHPCSTTGMRASIKWQEKRKGRLPSGRSIRSEVPLTEEI